MTATEKRRALTECQRRVYDAILTHYRDQGGYPSLRELCDALGISSVNGVLCNLRALVKKGWITYAAKDADDGTPAQARGIRVPELQEAARLAATKLLKA